MQCKNGIDYDECNNKATCGEYCDNCAEENYTNAMEALCEGYRVNTRDQQLKAREVE